MPPELQRYALQLQRLSEQDYNILDTELSTVPVHGIPC